MGGRTPRFWPCARANPLGARHTTRENKPGFPLRAASNPSQFNKSAQSDQQDLIGEMETNRQQKPACVEEVLLGRHRRRRRNIVEQRRDLRLAKLENRLRNGVVRGANKHTLYALALVRPVMMVVGLTLLVMRVPVARRASVTARSFGMPSVGCLGTIVPMMRAAPHNEVNHQNRGTQIVQQTGHTSPQFRRNPHRQANYTILSRIAYTTCGVCESRPRVAFPTRTAIHSTHESGIISSDFAPRTRRSEGCRTAGSLRLLPRSCEGHGGHRGTRGSSGNRSAGPSAALGS